MELSSSIIKKILYLWKWNFQALRSFYTLREDFPSSKDKKNPPQENFLYSRKMELSNSNIKNSLYFLKRKLFLYFRNGTF